MVSSFEWVKHICNCRDSGQLRGVFNRARRSIKNPNVHNIFFERIHYLKRETKSEFEDADLEKLRWDIEMELEKGIVAQILTRINKAFGHIGELK